MLRFQSAVIVNRYHTKGKVPVSVATKFVQNAASPLQQQQRHISEGKPNSLLSALRAAKSSAGKNKEDKEDKSGESKKKRPRASNHQQKHNKATEKKSPPKNANTGGMSAIDSFLQSGTLSNEGRNNRNNANATSSPKWWTLGRSDSNTQTTTTTTTINRATNHKSIFDVFSLDSAASSKDKTGGFDPDASNAFESLLDAYFLEDESKNTAMESKYKINREIKETILRWLREESQVPVKLPVLAKITNEGIETVESKKERAALTKQIREELGNQAKMFRKQFGLNQKQYTYATHILHDLAALSFRNHKALAVVIIWEKMKEAGDMNNETINACLRASSMFGGGLLSRSRSSLHLLSPETSLFQTLNAHNNNSEQSNDNDEAIPENDASVPEQLANVHDILYEPTQQSISIRMRRMISIGNADKALALIESGMEGSTKLRAYRQVFSLSLGMGDIEKALHLLQKMKQGHGNVPVEAEQFVQVLTALAEKGYFGDGSNRINNIEDMGYTYTSGSGLLDEIVNDMSLHVDSISSSSAMRLRRALFRGFHDADGGSSGEIRNSPLVVPKPLKGPVEEHTLIADRVSIDPSTGVCIPSGVTLRQIGLDQPQKQQMKDGLLKLVGQKHKVQAMLSFSDWLSTREGRPFTVIVDGANIAFYMQNFDRGKFNFHQIQFVVTALQGMGENPLVLLPSKYLKDKFQVALGTSYKVQTLGDQDRSIAEQLFSAGILYSVPQGCLDDYFWILASVSDQANCATQTVETTGVETSRRWSGARPVVLTNDQGRDHQQYQLLEPRLFNRWYSSTIVNYSFTGFVDDVCIDPEIVFNPADVFSREIQGNTPETEGSSTCWHFPVDDWGTTDWFCIRLPSRPKE